MVVTRVGRGSARNKHRMAEFEDIRIGVGILNLPDDYAQAISNSCELVVRNMHRDGRDGGSLRTLECNFVMASDNTYLGRYA